MKAFREREREREKGWTREEKKCNEEWIDKPHERIKREEEE